MSGAAKIYSAFRYSKGTSLWCTIGREMAVATGHNIIQEPQFGKILIEISGNNFDCQTIKYFNNYC